MRARRRQSARLSTKGGESRRRGRRCDRQTTSIVHTTATATSNVITIAQSPASSRRHTRRQVTQQDACLQLPIRLFNVATRRHRRVDKPKTTTTSRQRATLDLFTRLVVVANDDSKRDVDDSSTPRHNSPANGNRHSRCRRRRGRRRYWPYRRRLDVEGEQQSRHVVAVRVVAA